MRYLSLRGRGRERRLVKRIECSREVFEALDSYHIAGTGIAIADGVISTDR